MPRPSSDAAALPQPPSGWRAALLRMGHRRSVLLITVFSTGVSVLVTVLLTAFGSAPGNVAYSLGTAIAVPLLVAPLVSHKAMGLLFELEAARAQLHQAAVRDSLTRAYNRRYFMGRLDDEVARARRTGTPLAALMIDVDHFKAINDRHGHAAGDEVLERIAPLLGDALRPYDLVARYGGEEFVALLPGAGMAQAQAAGERVRAAVQGMPVSWAPADGRGGGGVTASIGFSILGDDADTAGALMGRADQAMYAAKRGGRNRCHGLPPPAGTAPSLVASA